MYSSLHWFIFGRIGVVNCISKQIVIVDLIVCNGLHTCINRFVCFHCSEGQPESIVADIDNMVKSYVEKVGQDLFRCTFLCSNAQPRKSDSN